MEIIGISGLYTICHGPWERSTSVQGRTDLALLVQRQDHGMRRRVDIEADDILDLGDEVGVVGQLEEPELVGSQAMGAPDALHRADRQPDGFGHRGAGPAGGLLRRVVVLWPVEPAVSRLVLGESK